MRPARSLMAAVLVMAACIAWAAKADAAPARAGNRLPTLGQIKGTVITAAGERVVIQKAEGGQMTLEPRWLGMGRGRDRRQIEYFGKLKQGDKIEAVWKLDEGTHFCVVGITRVGPDGKPIDGLPQAEGRVGGTVITASPERMVIQQAEGGQITLEAGRVQRDGQTSVDPEQSAFLRELKQGDAVDAYWTLNHEHFIIGGLARPEAVGAADAASLAEQVQALRAEVAGLRQQLAALREQVGKALEQPK